MADKNAPTTATDSAALLKQTRADAVKAWHECKTEDDRRSAVVKFPVLVEIYSEAQNYK